MKLNTLAMIIAAATLSIGAANAATKPDNSVTKKITLVAQINDGIFVSKPDGKTWYDEAVELDAADYKQAHFSKVLPIRVWTKNPGFQVSLAQPLKMSSGSYEMQNAQVLLTTADGDKALSEATAQVVTQPNQTTDGYDSIYNLKIGVDAPPAAAKDKASTNGSYSGDLVMYFEPKA